MRWMDNSPYAWHLKVIEKIAWRHCELMYPHEIKHDKAPSL